MPFEFTKNYKFTILNNENVWAKAMNRVVNEKVPVDKAVDETDRPHQGSGRLINVVPSARERTAARRLRATRLHAGRSGHDVRDAPPRRAPDAGPRGRRPLSPRQVWGLLLVAPYLADLRWSSWSTRSATAFWLARHPQLYVELFDDPIFLRTAVNTLVFLIVAINVKMVIALFLSGFFTHKRWWVKVLSVLFVLPWAVPSIPTILSVRFMLNPEWGVINHADLQAHRRRRPELAERPDARAVAVDGRAHLEVAAVLDPDPARRPARHPGRALRGRVGRRRRRAGSGSASSPGRRCSTLYVTCTLLSMIWTLGDFNSVYLLTGGGPADLTHVLATLGIRYLRLDQVDLAMASIVVRAAAGPAAGLLHDEAAVAMS